MTRYVIEPQRDVLYPKDSDDSTWFVKCEDDEAEVFAVIDTELEELIDDCPTRRSAEALVMALEHGWLR